MFQKVLFLSVFVFKLDFINCKYVEGQLKTFENWAFLARFCFLSERGQYEYVIEYNKRMGVPNLLLYYDTSNQWPAVYKSKKTCSQKEAVLSVRDNQIVPLTTHYPDSLNSGCYIKEYNSGNTGPRDTVNPKPKQPDKPEPNDGSYYDQFLKTTTVYPDPDNFSTTENDTITSIDNSSLISNTTGSKSDDAYDTRTYENEENSTASYENYNMETENLFDGEVTKNGSKIKRSVLKNGTWRPTGSNKASITIICHQKGRFISARERWWFIAVSNCRNQKGIDIKYKFLMTNGAPGDYWHEHFSADEMHILPILMFYCLVYMLLFVAIVICSVELKSRHLLHTTYKIFFFSVILQEIGIISSSIAYIKYSLTGLGPYSTMGGVFMALSEVSFLLLMLLMAKGYTITRARLSCKSTVKLTIFINLYTLTYFVLYIQSEDFDPGEVLYLYESGAGLGLCGLRVAAWGMFICSLAATMKKYPEKGNFYYPLSVFGSLWFISGPAFILVANNHIDKWVRESIVCGVQMFIAFAGHLMFLFLTMPSRANKNFPYHVRTSQIGVADNLDGDFTHHPYEPNQTVIIPLTRRTEELLNGVYNQYLRRHENGVERNLPPLRRSHVSFPEPSAPYDSTSPTSSNVATILTPNHYNNNINGNINNLNLQSTDIGIVQSPTVIRNIENTNLVRTTINDQNSSLSSTQMENTNDNTQEDCSFTNDEQFDHLKSNPFVIDSNKRNKLELAPLDRSRLQFKNGDITRLSFGRGNLSRNPIRTNGEQDKINEVEEDEENRIDVPVHLFAVKNK